MSNFSFNTEKEDHKFHQFFWVMIIILVGGMFVTHRQPKDKVIPIGPIETSVSEIKKEAVRVMEADVEIIQKEELPKLIEKTVDPTEPPINKVLEFEKIRPELVTLANFNKIKNEELDLLNTLMLLLGTGLETTTIDKDTKRYRWYTKDGKGYIMMLVVKDEVLSVQKHGDIK